MIVAMKYDNLLGVILIIGGVLWYTAVPANKRIAADAKPVEADATKVRDCLFYVRAKDTSAVLITSQAPVVVRWKDKTSVYIYIGEQRTPNEPVDKGTAICTTDNDTRILEAVTYKAGTPSQVAPK